MTHLGTLRLETDRLILRRFTPEDDTAMFNNWCSDSDVTKYLTWKTHETIAETRRVLSDIWLCHYDEPDFYQWAIAVKDTNELIGSIGVVKQDTQTKMVHIGYCIGKAWWRKGYVSEALTRLVRFFFEDVGVNRIESRHDPRNPISGRVMQKAGLRYEGMALEADVNNQGICDAVNYAVLAKDYFRKSPPVQTAKPYCKTAAEPEVGAVTDLLYRLYDMDYDELLDENKLFMQDERQGFYLAYIEEKPIGVAHAALRSDYVNGTEFIGVSGYLEAIYVEPEYRLNGAATALVRACEAWAAERGCREFVSDCLLDNTDSYRFHLALGFRETERCIFFKKDLSRPT